MNENAKLWVETLKTGKFPDGTEFKQARRRLRRENGFCCLGVACEVYRQVTNHGEWTNKLSMQRFDDGVFDSDEYSLPAAVMDWLDLANENGEFKNMSLVSMNDSGEPFDKIAQVIEENWDELQFKKPQS